jgi:hypothetical protein
VKSKRIDERATLADGNVDHLRQQPLDDFRRIVASGLATGEYERADSVRLYRLAFEYAAANLPVARKDEPPPIAAGG